MNLVGQKLGGYRILDEVGPARWGTVYRAYEAAPNRVVAIKVLDALPPGLVGVPEQLAPLRHDAPTATGQHHPNLVAIRAVGREHDLCFVVMDYHAEPTLDELLDRDGPLPLRRVAAIVTQLAGALDHVHHYGLIHGNVRPSSIFIGPDDHVTLAEPCFVLATPDGEAAAPATSLPCSVAEYTSPEQAQGQAVDKRADLYSLALITYKLITGRLPFEAAEPAEVLRRHIEEPPPLARVARPGLPRAVEYWLSQGLAKLPGDRWTSARAMAEALQDIVLAEETRRRSQPLPLVARPIYKEPSIEPAERAAPLAPPGRRPNRRLRLLILLALAALALLTGATVIALAAWNRAHTVEPTPSPTPTPTATIVATPAPSPSPSPMTTPSPMSPSPSATPTPLPPNATLATPSVTPAAESTLPPGATPDATPSPSLSPSPAAALSPSPPGGSLAVPV